MKCPLAAIGEDDIDNIKENQAFDCLKEHCAWWDKGSNGCSVFLISRSLMSIVDILIDIKERYLTL